MAKPHRLAMVVAGTYIITAIVLCSGIALLYGPIVSIPARIFRNYNEGLTAYMTECVSAGCLYRPLDSLTANLYPPLFYYANAMFSLVVGDPIVSARILALAGLLLTAVNVGVIAFSVRRDRLFASFAGLVFLGTMAASFRGGYVAMADPQWLAHGVMTTGLILFLRHRQRKGQVILSAALMVLAGLMKHSLLPTPIAVTAWCLVAERHLVRLWISTLGGIVTFSLALMYLLFGKNFFFEILLSNRDYSFYSSVLNTSKWISPVLVFCALALILMESSSRSRETGVLSRYLAFSLLSGFIFCGAQGSNYNHVFDFHIALIMLSVVAVGRWVEQGGPGSSARTARLALGMAAMALPLVAAAPEEAARVPGYADRLLQRERETAEDIAFVSGHDGPVWCEMMSLCYWGGKPWSIEFFMAGQKMKGGQISQDAVVARIARHEASLIQLEENDGHLPWLPDRIMTAIDTHYKLVRKSSTGGFFYEPRQ